MEIFIGERYKKVELITYEEMQQILKEKPRRLNLLLGNGFSISYNSKIFSYNALSNYIESIDNKLLLRLFDLIKTKNFEMIMQQLENFCEIAQYFGNDETLVKIIKEASNSLKEGLIDAIKELHPEHVFSISDDKSNACARFLKTYLDSEGHVFTTNYDVLLYWVLMRNKGSLKYADGFGRDLLNSEEIPSADEQEYSELRWGNNKNLQNIHYLHGALPLFDSGIEIIKEEYDKNNFLIDKIKNKIDNGEYPIFVTAGNGDEKLKHIKHNHYLSYCYDQLSSITGSLITFGFNFGEYDEHIIDAINIASKFRGKSKGKTKDEGKLYSVYIGIYSEEDYKHILAIKNKFKCKVYLYDATTVKIWG